MASSPTYDPNLMEQANGYAKIQATKAPCTPSAPLLNRATQGLYPPGSTFKTITAAAALDDHVFGPSSGFNDPGYCTEYGKQVHNANDQSGPERFGNITLFDAYVHSVNAVFCMVGQKLGAGRILEEAKKFGFYSLPPLETPANARSASGLYNRGKLWYPKSPQFDVDPGRLAFGQERMLVTPLQMAMVAATIANGGVVMRPYSVAKVTASNGSTVTRTRPDALGRVISGNVAAEITSMMVGVVQSGTGTSAQIPGVQVAGKTGTAETGIQGVNTTWFICFAPADHPRYAVAAVVERQHGYGGSVAAPIAKAVLQALLGRG
jgi:peptidoglycan glycosyltransferase